MASSKYNAASKAQADAAQKAVIDYNQNNPYLSKINAAAEAAQNYGTFTYDKAKPTYTDRYGDKVSAATDAVVNFKAAEKPIYTNRYGRKIDETLQGVLGMPAFSYDEKTDPAFQAYKKAYSRESDRAVQDAIGKAAAANGGAVSTAGVTAATQAGQYYAGKLTDMIPQLYDQAYNRYLDEYNRQVNNLGLLQKQEATDYSRHRDAVGDYESDRNWDYNQRLNALDVLKAAEAADYARHRDAVSDYEADRNFEYSLHNDGYDRRMDELNLYRSLEADGRTRLADTADRLSAQDATEYERYLDSQAQSASSSSGSNQQATYNALGIPNAYMDYVQKAAELNDGTDEGKHRALGYMYTLAEAGKSSGLIDQDAFERMLLLAGLSYDDWTAYIGANEKPDAGRNLVSIPGRYTK